MAITQNPTIDFKSQQPALYYYNDGACIGACIGTPEGSITAGYGAILVDVQTGNAYIKQSASGNTGWVVFAIGGSGITGSGTAGKLTKFTGATAIGNSLITESGGNLESIAAAVFVQSTDTSVIPLRIQAPIGLAVEGFNYLDSAGTRRVIISASGTFALGGFSSAITPSLATDVKLYFDQNGGLVNNQLMMSKAGGSFVVIAGIDQAAINPGRLLQYNSSYNLVDSIADGSTAGEINVGGLLKVNFTSPAQGQVHIVPATTLTRGIYLNAPVAYASDLIKIDVNSVEKFAIDQQGQITVPQLGITTPSIGPSNTQGLAFAAAQTTMMVSASTYLQIDTANRFYIAGAYNVIINHVSASLNFGTSTLGDTNVSRLAAAVLRIGNASSGQGSLSITPSSVSNLAPLHVRCRASTNEGVLIESSAGVVIGQIFSDGTNWYCGTTSAHEVDLIANGTSNIRYTDTTLGFFGVTPVVRQTMGAATAGATYTATEQTMLQAVYNAVRNLGLGT